MTAAPESMHAFDAEASVIGATFLDESAVERSGCAVEHFSDSRHRVVWAALQALRSQQAPIDCASVTGQLERTGKLSAAGGADYVADLSESAGSSANVGHHGKTVSTAAKARALRRVFTSAVEALDEGFAMSGLDGMQEAASAAQAASIQVMSDTRRQDMHTHKAAVRTAVERARVAYEARAAGKEGGGLPWLMPAHTRRDCMAPDLSSMLPPMVGGDLVTLAARTSAGKTVAGYQLAHDIARHTGRLCDYFTSEVDAGGMGARSLVRHAGVDGLRLRNGELTDGEIARMLDYSQRGRADQPVAIWDQPTQTIEYIAAVLRVVEAARSEEERGGLIVLDYYQRIQSTHANRMRMDKFARLAHLSPVIKGLAMELRRPVLLLAQLRRDVPWGQAGKEDIDGSKTLGDESDMMVIISNAKTDAPNSDAPDGYAESLVAKNRNGAVGGVLPMRFNGAGQQFEIWGGERWQPARNGRSNGR